MAPPKVPADPIDWRPQEPLVTRVAVKIADPIVEPLWSGTRVVVHVDTHGGAMPPAVRMIERSGLDLTAEEPMLAAAIGTAVLAQDAVLDGVLTSQATRGGTGMAIIPEARLSVMDAMLSRDTGIAVSRSDTVEVPSEEAFVAVDLLAIDGARLLDVPLLERKRLLDGALAVGNLVRITPYIRPPIGSLALTWHALGFREMAFKAGNGHYTPTGEPSDWAVVRINPR